MKVSLEDMYYQFKKSQTIIFSSGELAQLLGTTTQTIMNYRKRGMPYCSMTLWGYYEYNFDAIQWIFDNGYRIANIKKLPFAYRYKLFNLKIENDRLKIENARLKELLNSKSYP